jgi:hypothetical protein
MKALDALPGTYFYVDSVNTGDGVRSCHRKGKLGGSSRFKHKSLNKYHITNF